jgi:pantoate--beta-alanine ligase
VSQTVVARTREELSAALADVRAIDQPGPGRRVALVPTMGALHEGHRALVARAATLADAVVVSIFLNPLQFAPGEDLDKYPKTFARDLELCQAEGVSVVFAPTPDVVYPYGEPTVKVAAGQLGSILEGASRPGHFDGVLTVVAKLFGLVRPDVAVFGEKDAQQLALVSAMVRDLDLGVAIEPVPIVRTPQGLARSSRNIYLDDAAATAALALVGAVRAAVAAGAAGASVAQVRAAAAAVLDAEHGVAVDYCVLVDPQTFGELPPAAAQGLLLVAARVGTTRLIDNGRVALAPSGAEAS